MLNTYVQERQAGKTTEIITRLTENDNLIVAVPTNSIKRFYPIDLHKRVFTFDQLLKDQIRGLRFTKILIDEGFLLQKDKLAHLFYFLGQHNYEVDAYGTI